MKSVLVLEDEPNLREVYAQFVGKAGYAVVEAALVSDALELLDHAKPDLIVLERDRVPGTLPLQVASRRHARPRRVWTGPGDRPERSNAPLRARNPVEASPERQTRSRSPPDHRPVIPEASGGRASMNGRPLRGEAEVILQGAVRLRAPPTTARGSPENRAEVDPGAGPERHRALTRTRRDQLIRLISR